MYVLDWIERCIEKMLVMNIVKDYKKEYEIESIRLYMNSDVDYSFIMFVIHENDEENEKIL